MRGNEKAGRVLVIDDEQGMRDGCRRALTLAGFVADTAENVDAALALLDRHSYELFLIDVMLPDGSGLDLLDPILRRDPNAICIIITGFSSIEVAVEAIRRGAYNFLSKPFTSDTLLVAVNQGLERRRLKAIESAALDLAQAKEELERLDKAKSQLMLTVAHELRAPVAAVQSYINLIVAGYVPEPDLKPTLQRVQERLQETLDVVGDLLDLAHLKQANDRQVSTAAQDMAGILQEVTELLRQQAQAKGQSLQVDIQARPDILANRDHLRQIWTNLISNAIKYTPEGGRIQVRLEADGEKLMGAVEDTGIGIAAADIPNLFQEFFRSDQAKASGQIGTGLGLSIVKQIVDALQGQITVHSRLGQGTCFTFVLPLRPPVAQPAEEPTPARLPASTLTMPRGEPRTHARAFILGDDVQPGESRTMGRQ